jgi:hypothetical protein
MRNAAQGTTTMNKRNANRYNKGCAKVIENYTAKHGDKSHCEPDWSEGVAELNDLFRRYSPAPKQSKVITLGD